jgi:beta-glucosidase
MIKRKLGEEYMNKKTKVIAISVVIILLIAGGILGTKWYLNRDTDQELVKDEVEMVNNDNVSTTAVIKEDAVKVYLSSTENSQDMSWYTKAHSLSNTLTEGESLDLTEVDNASDATTIEIDVNTTYDPFLGIGTSLEETTVWNLMQLTEEERKAFIYALVDPVNGGGMTLFRLTIGTSDFTGLDFYTYYDIKTKEGDPNWYPENGEEGFSIQKDVDAGIIEVVKMVQEAAQFYGVADEIRFFSSSWTPPGWMKAETANSKSYSNNDLLLKGGSLNDEFIDDLAMYYTRYVEEYAKLGIPIYGLTLQNEPMLEIDYPSCHITGEQEGKLAVLLKQQLESSEILKESGSDVPRFWAFDHNPSELISYMTAVYSVEGAFEALDGAAVHDYSGSLTEMEKLKEIFYTDTDKSVHLTERSVWGTAGADSIINYFRNGATSYNAWVTMMDSAIDHYQWVGTPSPTLFIRQSDSDTEYWACPEFYIMGNFGRFIRPGYVRVESDYGSSDTITNVVYANQENGTMTAVVVNQTNSQKSFRLLYDGKQIMGTIPAGNVATLIWSVEPEKIADPIINAGTTMPEIADTSERTFSEEDVITLGNEAVTLDEASAFDSKGSFQSNVTSGDYLDYLLDVKVSGSYSITYSVDCDTDGGSVAMAYQVITGKKTNPAQAGENAEYINIPGLYGAQKIRYAVNLEEGLQTLRFLAYYPGFKVTNIEIAPIKEVSIGKDGSTVSVLDFYDAHGSHAIENDKNIGYTSGGSYLDIAVNVEAAGKYNLSMLYASTASAPSITFQSVKDDVVTDLATLAAPSTGDWAAYQTSEAATIDLAAGEYIIRLLNNGDGVNLIEFNCMPVE